MAAVKSKTKKDRPKSGKSAKSGMKSSSDKTKSKKRATVAAPDKAAEGLTETVRVEEIPINPELLALKIKEEDLQQIRMWQTQMMHPVMTSRETVLIRRLRPLSVPKLEETQPERKVVFVSKPAPPTAAVIERLCPDGSAIRIGADGKIIPHTIIGTVEDYMREAEVRLEWLPAQRPTSSTDKGQLTVKYETPCIADEDTHEESKALKNWQRKMKDRRRQQDYLSGLVRKPVSQLAMNQGDVYRQSKEFFNVLSHALEDEDYDRKHKFGRGVGNPHNLLFLRVDKEDEAPLCSAFTPSVLGHPPPVEHIGVPHCIEKETGERGRLPTSHKAWHNSDYLREKLDTYKSFLQRIDPNPPEIGELEITGKSVFKLDTTESAKEPEDRSEDTEGKAETTCAENVVIPITGPSMVFGTRKLSWLGTDSPAKPVEIRLNIETMAGCKASEKLNIYNNGTTVLYYRWTKADKRSPFETSVTKNIPRFYFNSDAGALLPAESLTFTFFFKSACQGVFSEQWRFSTLPLLEGGAPIIVTLRGVALLEDVYLPHREKLQNELAHLENEQMVRSLLHSLINGISTVPVRPASPQVPDTAQEAIFKKQNPSELHYQKRVVNDLAALYESMGEKQEGEEAKQPKWDVNVATVRKEILANGKEEWTDMHEALLEQWNSNVNGLLITPVKPTYDLKYLQARQILFTGLEKVADVANYLSASLGKQTSNPDLVIDDLTLSLDGSSKLTAKSVMVLSSQRSRNIATDLSDQELQKNLPKEQIRRAKSKNSKQPSKVTKPVIIAPEHSNLDYCPRPPPAPQDSLQAQKYHERLLHMVHHLLSDTLVEMWTALDEISANATIPSKVL